MKSLTKSQLIGIRDLPIGFLLGYVTSSRSLLRCYQDLFVSQEGSGITCDVVELGGQLIYNHTRYFPNAKSFQVTNVARDHSVFLDATNMSLMSNSQDCFLCLSVMEHVFEFSKVIDEVYRTLKPGGSIIIVVPFAYPLHDEVDYWRFTPDSINLLLCRFKIVRFCHLGGKYSSMAGEFQRPRGRITMKHLIPKMLGWLILVLGRILERKDGFASGFGIVAVKPL